MERWAPVVFGRTANSDNWWRAVPGSLDETGWLGTVIRKAVARGGQLDRRPRFLLAQDATHRIVGVACQAGELSADMRSDGSRELYCFVGWVAPREEAPDPRGPDWADLVANYARWAGDLYSEVVGPVWGKPRTEIGPHRLTTPEAVPWEPGRGPDSYKPGAYPEEGAWAEDAWPVLWAALQAADKPLTCVIGWEHEKTARSDGVTHLGAADAPARPLPQSRALSIPQLPQSPESDGLTTGTLERPAEPGKPPLEESLPALPGWWRRLPSSMPISARITAAAVGVAAVVVAVIEITSSGASPPPPSQGTSRQVIVPSSSAPTRDSLLEYRAGALSPGQAANRMAVWSGGVPGADACSSRLAAASSTKPVSAHPGLALCLELKGRPTKYEFIEITKVTNHSVTATATTWP